MKAHQHEFSIQRMSRLLGVTRSGYYQVMKAVPSKRGQANEALKLKIRTLFEAYRGLYGSPRIHAALQAHGEAVNRKRVARLMKIIGLVAKMKRQFKVTTRQAPQAQAAPNLLQQRFTVSKPNQVWVAGYQLYPNAGRLALHGCCARPVFSPSRRNGHG
jgi:putative transposase